jgi:adenylylsulfate kinase
MHHFLETRKRSIIKTISWKIIATAISFNVLYLQTGDIARSLETSGIVLFIGTIAYYLHERAWNSVHWEKQHIEAQNIEN